MKRRAFLATAAALCLAAPGLAAAADAPDMVAYEPGLIAAALDEGKTVFVDYHATWCPTCARQGRVIAELRAANPAYDSAMTFVKVDWDEYGRHEVTTSRNIPRRSTLLVLKGDQELGRLVAETGTDEIRELMDKGVAASGS